MPERSESFRFLPFSIGIHKSKTEIAPGKLVSSERKKFTDQQNTKASYKKVFWKERKK
jgi:hypothetical protein